MLPADNALNVVAEQQVRFATWGTFIFVLQHGSPRVEVHSDASGSGLDVVGSESDMVAVLPTTDKFEVVRLLGTNGNHAHSADQIRAWLRELDRRQPFVLLGASYDFVEGAFLKPVDDPRGLAQSVYTFCPDFWDQGLGLVESAPSPQEGIAAYFTTERYFYFWWD